MSNHYSSLNPNDHQNGEEVTDRRPAPKPRKRPHLSQAYSIWHELVKMRQRHHLRIIAAECGKSSLDPEMERQFTNALALDDRIDKCTALIAQYAAEVGPVAEWLASIKGVSLKSAAKVLAAIDNISKFDTISKLWRYAGLAVVDGRAERRERGKKSRYVGTLKSTLVYLIAEQSIRHQTPVYSDVYYEAKARYRERHPVTICREESVPWEECSSPKKHHKRYNPGHLDIMARRKMMKVFLAHLWKVWRVSEALPIGQPYVIAHLNKHTHVIPPPNQEVIFGRPIIDVAYTAATV